MTPEEFIRLAEKHWLTDIHMSSYRLEMDLENQIHASLLEPSVANRIRQIYRDDIGRDTLGMEARLPGEGIRFSYPSLIMTGRKEA